MREQRSSRISRCVVSLCAAAAAALAGCSSDTGGQAAPGARTGDSSSGVPTNSAGSIALPHRPKDISLAGVDPCSLLTPAQQTRLNAKSGVPRGTDARYGAPRCTYQYQGSGSAPSTAYFDINTVTSKDITSWLDPTLYDQITENTVDGYPGLRIYPKGHNVLECTNAVSVAKGQMLLVTFDYVPLGTSQQRACAMNEQVAAAAMTTLRSMK